MTLQVKEQGNLIIMEVETSTLKYLICDYDTSQERRNGLPTYTDVDALFFSLSWWMAIKGDIESQIYLHPHTLMSLATHSTMKLFILINKVLQFQKTFVQEDASVKNIYDLFQTLLESI